MIHYEIRSKADRLLTFNGSPSAPAWSTMDGDALAFPTYESAESFRGYGRTRPMMQPEKSCAAW